AGGALISFESLHRLGEPRLPLARFVVWPLLISLFAKTVMASVKFCYGRKLQSAALTADAWNDTVDTISAVAALFAVGLTLFNPAQFGEADRYGGRLVGLVVVRAGARVAGELAAQ